MTNAQEIMGDSYRFVKKFTKTVKDVLPKVNLKASKDKQLFYSPNYKVMYTALQEQIALEILNTAEMVLSNFDYQSIDLVDQSYSEIIENEDGTFEYLVAEDIDTVFATASPQTANMIFSINNATITSIDNALNNPLSDTYSDILKWYGRYNSKGEFTANLPAYDNDGKPRYDLNLSEDSVDISGVLGYNVYMIEEDDLA